MVAVDEFGNKINGDLDEFGVIKYSSLNLNGDTVIPRYEYVTLTATQSASYALRRDISSSFVAIATCEDSYNKELWKGFAGAVEIDGIFFKNIYKFLYGGSVATKSFVKEVTKRLALSANVTDGRIKSIFKNVSLNVGSDATFFKRFDLLFSDSLYVNSSSSKTISKLFTRALESLDELGNDINGRLDEFGNIVLGALNEFGNVITTSLQRGAIRAHIGASFIKEPQKGLDKNMNVNDTFFKLIAKDIAISPNIDLEYIKSLSKAYDSDANIGDVFIKECIKSLNDVIVIDNLYSKSLMKSVAVDLVNGYEYNKSLSKALEVFSNIDHSIVKSIYKYTSKDVDIDGNFFKFFNLTFNGGIQASNSYFKMITKLYDKVINYIDEYGNISKRIDEFGNVVFDVYNEFGDIITMSYYSPSALVYYINNPFTKEVQKSYNGGTEIDDSFIKALSKDYVANAIVSASFFKYFERLFNVTLNATPIFDMINRFIMRLRRTSVDSGIYRYKTEVYNQDGYSKERQVVTANDEEM